MIKNVVKTLVTPTGTSPVSYVGIVDTGNSSATPLGIGGVFTGTGIDVLNYAIIAVNIATDQDSATDGLSIQQSSDNVNWDHPDEFTINGGRPKNFTIQPYAQYMRVVYTNGAVGQTYFRLQVILKSVNIKPSSHRIADDIVSDDDAELVKSCIAVETNDDNIFSNVNVQNPMPSDGDSVYAKDLILELSDQGGFTIPTEPTADKRRILGSFVSDVHIEKLNNTATNPKAITLTFKRPVLTSSFGMNSGAGTFSNVKITIYQGLYSLVLIDESTDPTTYTIRIFEIPPIKFSKILIEFYTANTISIGLIGIFKYREVAARLQALNDFGNVVDVAATNQGNLRMAVMEYGDTPSIDAFSRLRVSNPYTIYDSKQIHDKQPIFWDELTGGSATSTHSANNAATVMTVTASATDYAQRQTKQRFNYQAGKSLLYLATFHCPQQTGVIARIGSFDGTGTNYMTPNNGIFFQIDDTNLSWNIAKNGTTTETVTQANWNYDPLDGTGPSGITLDTDAALISLWDIEFLGTGRCRCGFVIDGVIRYCHYFNHANDPSFTSVYMSTSNLSIRYDIQSDGSGGGTLDHICSTVMSEGGQQQTGVLRSIDTDTVHLDANVADTPYVALAIRLKSNYIDITVKPEYFSVISETNDDFRWQILLNPTYNGTLTYADITNSAIQSATGATANDITDYGLVIDSGYSKSSAVIDRRIVTALTIGSLIDGTRDELILALTPLSSNADLQSSLTIRELL